MGRADLFSASAQHKGPQLDGQLQGKAVVGVVQVHAGDLGDPLQAIEQRIAVQVEPFGGLADVAVLGKERLQRVHKLCVVAGVVRLQGCQGLAMELGQLVARLQPPQEVIEGQIAKREHPPPAKEAAHQGQRLLGLGKGTAQAHQPGACPPDANSNLDLGSALGDSFASTLGMRFNAVQQGGIARAAQGRQIVVVRAEKDLNARMQETSAKLARDVLARDVLAREHIAREHIAREFRTCLLHTGIQVFLCPHDDDLAALCSAGDATLLDGIEAHAQRTRERIAERAPEVEVAVGIGRAGAGLVGLRRSFAQAQESLSLVRSLFGGGRVLSFGDLTLYHLLGRLQACDELAEFHGQTLASLETYDAGHDTQLVDTLEAFFAQHGNVSQTAERLYLHRNSLLYRLERIAEITGMDLDDADDRFALQLAVKLRPFVLGACAE